MGAHFKLEHANFVAYLTAEQYPVAPRSDAFNLWEFLFSLSDPYEIQRTTISTDLSWQESLRETASKAVEHVPPDRQKILSEREVATILKPLREFFTGYDLYVLLVQASNPSIIDKKRVESAFHFLAKHSSVNTLVLLPREVSAFANLVDPFPALQSLARFPVPPPAAVFWTPTEVSVAYALDEGMSFFGEYIASGKFSKKEIDRAIEKESYSQRVGRILHLSDLHFGDPLADRRRNYLRQHLFNVIDKKDRIVISGDFLNTPDVELRARFDEFLADLRAFSDKPPVLVPGNHDVRLRGNALYIFGRNSEQITDIGFEPIVVDHELRSVFFCFNSCDGGDFAIGRVSDEQRLSRGSRYEEMLRSDRRLSGYKKIAVVHHHPYTYGTHSTTLYERIMERVFKNPDRLVAFDNASEFVSWCGNRDVSLIMHGHKHIPHMVQANIDIRDQSKEIMVVGCGSSTGVENKPMCYDVININPGTGHCSASFYHDPDGDGSGFSLQNITIDLRQSLPERR